MFFALSKTVSLLVMPLSLIVICFLLYIFLRRDRLRKIFFWTGFGMLIFFSNDFIANEAILLWEIPARPFDFVKNYELGIVLTGTTIEKEEPADRVYFAKGADRVTHTVQLYKLKKIRRILISGGTGRLAGEAEPEARKYFKAMVMMGVDPEDIMIDDETRNTYESAVAVKPMLERMNLTQEDCLLITSAFHLRRSLAVYRKAGLELDSFATDFYSHPRSFYPDRFLVPKIEAIHIWQKLFKEWIGMAAYKAAGYI